MGSCDSRIHMIPEKPFTHPSPDYLDTSDTVWRVNSFQNNEDKQRQ